MTTMSKRLITAALSAMATAAILIPAVPAEAAPAIQIHRVYFDSPGKDTRTNSSLNDQPFNPATGSAQTPDARPWRDRYRRFSLM